MLKFGIIAFSILGGAWIASVQAQTIGPGCLVAWDYPPESLTLIDGFRVYVDGAQAAEVPKTVQEVSCADLAMSQGQRVLEATAYNAAAESPRSDPLTIVFVDTAPGAPGNVRVVVSF